MQINQPNSHRSTKKSLQLTLLAERRTRQTAQMHPLSLKDPQRKPLLLQPHSITQPRVIKVELWGSHPSPGSVSLFRLYWWVCKDLSDCWVFPSLFCWLDGYWWYSIKIHSPLVSPQVVILHWTSVCTIFKIVERQLKTGLAGEARTDFSYTFLAVPK